MARVILRVPIASSTAGAKREVVALGFVAVTVGTSTRDGQIRPPNVYRLTYLETHAPEAAPTHDWQKITNPARRPRRRSRRPPRPCLVRVNAESA